MVIYSNPQNSIHAATHLARQDFIVSKLTEREEERVDEITKRELSQLDNEAAIYAAFVASQTATKVSGWGVYCCDFLLLPIAFCCVLLLPVSLLVVRRSITRTGSSKLPPSPAVSYCLPMSTTRLSYTSFTPQPPSQARRPAPSLGALYRGVNGRVGGRRRAGGRGGVSCVQAYAAVHEEQFVGRGGLLRSSFQKPRFGTLRIGFRQCRIAFGRYLYRKGLCIDHLIWKIPLSPLPTPRGPLDPMLRLSPKRPGPEPRDRRAATAPREREKGNRIHTSDRPGVSLELGCSDKAYEHRPPVRWKLTFKLASLAPKKCSARHSSRPKDINNTKVALFRHSSRPKDINNTKVALFRGKDQA
jgi:hypothetical protein